MREGFFLLKTVMIENIFYSQTLVFLIFICNIAYQNSSVQLSYETTGLNQY